MKIRKILNNNVVIAVDRDNQECVAMGCGLAFGKKSGDCFAKSSAEKIFILSNDEIKGRFTELIKNISLENMELSEKIISYAISNYNLRLNDIIHISLTDHINGLSQRLKNNIQLPNQLTFEIKRIYKDEFEIGKYALTLIEKYTGVTPIIDEAAFIALHFVNAETEAKKNDLQKTTSFINDIIKFTENFFNIKLNEDTALYCSFVSHLRFLSQRIFSDESYNENNFLYDILKEKYSEQAEFTEKVANIIKLKYNAEISDEEKAYLLIYVEKLTRV